MCAFDKLYFGIMGVCFHHYEKKKVLELALQLNFWLTKDTYNSLYLYVVSANEQVA